MNSRRVDTQPNRVLRIRRLVNMLSFGLAATVIGAVLIVAGWSAIQWSASSSAAAGGVMACIAAMVLLSVGTSTVIAAGIALASVGRFSLRSLFLMVAVCALLTAIWAGLARPWWQRHLILETPAALASSTRTRMMPTHTSLDMRVVTDKVTVTLPGYMLFFTAAVGLLPLVCLPLVLRLPKAIAPAPPAEDTKPNVGPPR